LSCNNNSLENFLVSFKVKNLSLILNGVLIVAVGILYFMQFSENSESNGQKAESTVALGDLQMAYVNSDSLLQNYKLYKELVKQLEGKRDRLEAEFTNRQQGLQNEVASYQRNQGNLTIGQARAIEEDLLQKQQNLQQYQQTLSQELVSEQNKINVQLYDKVSEFLESYGAENNVQLVLTYTRGNPNLLYANPGLDITKLVVNGLNQAYDNSGAVKTDSTSN